MKKFIFIIVGLISLLFSILLTVYIPSLTEMNPEEDRLNDKKAIAEYTDVVELRLFCERLSEHFISSKRLVLPTLYASFIINFISGTLLIYSSRKLNTKVL